MPTKTKRLQKPKNVYLVLSIGDIKRLLAAAESNAVRHDNVGADSHCVVLDLCTAPGYKIPRTGADQISTDSFETSLDEIGGAL